MDKSSNSNGITLPSLVFLVFLTLKLIGKIDWSWWWVTAPIWIVSLLWIIAVITKILLEQKQRGESKFMRALRECEEANEERRKKSNQQ